jgi:hypothetical protein
MISARMHARSAVLLTSLESRLPRLVAGWLLLVGLASGVRLAVSPMPQVDAVALTPYLLLILAPAASLMLALRWFRHGHALPQPEHRLARIGQWRELSASTAMRHPLYGTSGVMVSLLIGILLNLPLRAAEYFVTMPAISAAAPGWIVTLHFALTVDVVVMSSLYVVAFVSALRRVPLFPRLLMLVWMLDVAMQLMIAQAAGTADLPPAVASALHPLLEGNIKKTLISVFLWLPYLLLSVRVNVTYRHRVPA